MRHSKLALGIGVAAALAGLAGCAKVRYPKYYLLSVPASTSISASTSSGRTTPLLAPVAVRQFVSPGFLREGPIVYRESPERLGFYHYDRWAIDPQRALTSAIVGELRARGAFQSVDLYDGSTTYDLVLSGTLDHLEEVDEDPAVWIDVGVSARLKSMRTGEVLWEDARTGRVKLDNRSVPGVVAAMSSEMGRVVESLVTSMVDRLSAAGPAESPARQ